MNAQVFGCAHEVPVVTADDFRDKAILELLDSLGKEDPLIDHLNANTLQAILETWLQFRRTFSHTELLF